MFVGRRERWSGSIPGIVATETIPFDDAVKWVYRPGSEERQNGRVPGTPTESADQVNQLANENH